MDWGVWVAIIVAVYGAILSTYLGIRELRRERRSIVIILEYVLQEKEVNIRIVNSGVRPITIFEIGMSVHKKGERPKLEGWGVLPNKDVVDNERVPNLLPVKIEDGEQIVVPLRKEAAKYLHDNRTKIKIRMRVVDAEGNSYSRYKSMAILPDGFMTGEII